MQLFLHLYIQNLSDIVHCKGPYAIAEFIGKTFNAKIAFFYSKAVLTSSYCLMACGFYSHSYKTLNLVINGVQLRAITFSAVNAKFVKWFMFVKVIAKRMCDILYVSAFSDFF